MMRETAKLALQWLLSTTEVSVVAVPIHRWFLVSCKVIHVKISNVENKNNFLTKEACGHL